MPNRVRVWDLPTRLFHWALVACVAGLVITGHVGGAVMPWHARLGYAAFTLLLFRLCWGFSGRALVALSSFRAIRRAAVMAHLRGQRPPRSPRRPQSTGCMARCWPSAGPDGPGGDRPGRRRRDFLHRPARISSFDSARDCAATWYHKQRRPVADRHPGGAAHRGRVFYLWKQAPQPDQAHDRTATRWSRRGCAVARRHGLPLDCAGRAGRLRRAGGGWSDSAGSDRP